MKTWLKFIVLPIASLGAACGGVDGSHAQDSDAYIAPEGGISQALANGATNLTASLNGSMCLDVAGGAKQNGTRVQIAQCNNGPAQAWVRQGAQWRIFGNKCLNVVDGKDKNGTALQIWDCDDADGNSVWEVKGSLVQWKNHSRCLDISGGRVQPGTPMQIWDCDTNNGNQKWSMSGSTGSTGSVGSGGSTGSPVTQNNAAGSGIFGASPQGLDVAPYFWTWANGNRGYAITTPNDAFDKAGMASATIAFGLSSGSGCNIDGAINGMGDDIRSYVQNGRRIILSFGGALGTYLEDTCSDSGALADALDRQLTAVNARSLDFDIEGSHLDNMNRTNILLDALKNLQGRRQDLYVSFTLPVDDNSGLTNNGLNVIRGAVGKGVRVSRVNIMTMDFGHGPRSGQDFGDQCINAANATFGQLKQVFSGASDSDVWHAIGITPMIGENDDHYKMTVANAQKVANFARGKGVGMLSFWGMQRDRSGSGSLNDFTNVPQGNFDFLRAFNAAR